MRIIRTAALFAGFALLSACVQMTPITESKPVKLSSGQVSQIQQTVVRSFFDPESAQFRNVRAADVTLKDGNRERRVCGEVNAKNRMGGYAGYQFFGGVLNNGAFIQQDFFNACEPW